jgi:hypothetical protein
VTHWSPSLWLCWQPNLFKAAFSTEIIKCRWAFIPSSTQPPIPRHHESVKNKMRALDLRGLSDKKPIVIFLSPPQTLHTPNIKGKKYPRPSRPLSPLA